MLAPEVWAELAEGRVSEEALDQLVPLVLAGAADPPDWFVVRARKIARPDQPGLVRSKFTVFHPAMKFLAFDSALQMQPMPVRGVATQERRLVYETESFVVYLEIAPEADNAVSLKGQIVNRGERAGWRIGLWDDDLKVVLDVADAIGEGFFTFSDVDPRRSVMLTVGGEDGWTGFPLFVCGSLAAPRSPLPR